MQYVTGDLKPMKGTEKFSAWPTSKNQYFDDQIF